MLGKGPLTLMESMVISSSNTREVMRSPGPCPVLKILNRGHSHSKVRYTTTSSAGSPPSFSHFPLAQCLDLLEIQHHTLFGCVEGIEWESHLVLGLLVRSY
jgi:hypothetical protein